MRLDHEFTVPAPFEEVWQAVLDPARVAPCLPGASLTKVEGDSFAGTVKVKMGPISLLYKGNGEYQEKDEVAGKVVIKASGKDSRGAGTAAATVTLTLTGQPGGGTHGAVATELAITGRPAQFGRGMISEVGGRILDAFAVNLARSLAEASEATATGGVGVTGGAGRAAEAGGAAGSAGVGGAGDDRVGESGSGTEAGAAGADGAGGSGSAGKPRLRSVPAGGAIGEGEPIDLLDYAGRSVVKRVIPVVGSAVVLAVVLAIVRWVRRR
ncbi:carbon monoxide dehydrogenase subunit G [Amycolatopsis sulphurea]|uniref:Carbon monoxide dehydrogenase subunit G n=1 Tax=Amycolatopsis sulphurea TaxID=76022 RepID=A0A2A9F8K1_9PSEU|nr:SRPBCC family protein [Amycolatopsis sulphurea]PFG46739.1 carbon monoxide dehydrogenase subunit G [Amycolatopsis sulphurea]